jgi:hypothetical protein
MSNLSFSAGDMFKFRASRDREHAAAATQDLSREKDAARFMLAEFSKRSGIVPQCTVLLLDSDRFAMYSRRLANKSPRDPEPLREYLVTEASRLGYRVVDLAPLFLAYYREFGRPVDFYPFDRHWNGIGHGIAAQAAYKALSAQPGYVKCLAAEADENT